MRYEAVQRSTAPFGGHVSWAGLPCLVQLDAGDERLDILFEEAGILKVCEGDGSRAQSQCVHLQATGDGFLDAPQVDQRLEGGVLVDLDLLRVLLSCCPPRQRRGHTLDKRS